MKYRRILLKLSGEALMGNKDHGLDPGRLHQYAEEIAGLMKAGVEVAVVIGGGNIFRGLQGTGEGFDRLKGDYMGMLATVINCLALQSELEKLGVSSKLMSGIAIEPLAEKVYGVKAIEYLEHGQVVLLSGGTGNPYFTTDTASALRALEIRADAFLKGTRVDGVYSDDPEKNPNAERYDQLSFDEAYEKELKIMDLTAFTLCRENKLPVVVFDMNKEGNLQKIVRGENIGTLIS